MREHGWYREYFACFNIFITTLVTLFLIVWLGPADHSAPSIQPPQAILSRSVPYECTDYSGSLAYCWQDDCRGRWLPPRTRHCKDCRKCRVDFDHCCVFFGTCVAEGNLFFFVAFLLTVAPTVAIGLWEVVPVALHHRQLAMEQLWLSDTLYANWWNRWYSWIGGPIYRWGAGLLYCIWLYEPNNIATSLAQKEQLLYLPPVSFSPILYTIFGPLLAVFCTALAWVALRNVLQAGSTIDTIRSSRTGNSKGSVRLVWIPDGGFGNLNSRPSGSRIVEVPKAVNIYDFGRSRNFRHFLSRSPISLLSEPPCLSRCT